MTSSHDDQTVGSSSIATRGEVSNDLQPFVLGNLAWIATLILFLLIVVKVAIVAHFDPTTALALISTSSAPTIILGAITISLDTVVLVLHAGLAQIVMLFTMSRIDMVLMRALVILFGVIALVVTPWPFIPTILLLTDAAFEGPLWSLVHRPSDWLADKLRITFRSSKEGQELLDHGNAITKTLDELKRKLEIQGLDKPASEAVRAEARIVEEDVLDWRKRHRKELDRLHKQRTRLGVILLTIQTLFALALLLGDSPWLPAESFDFDGTSRPSIGYVFAQDETSLLVLRETDRTVQRIGIDEIEKRSYCRVRAERGPGPLIQLLFHETPYPQCVSSSSPLGSNRTV